MRGCVEWVCSVEVLGQCEFGLVFKAHGDGEGGREGGVRTPWLFDPTVTSGTNAQDHIRSAGRRGGGGHGRRHREISAWLV